MQKKRLVIIPAFVLALIITGLASVPFFMDAQSLKAQIIAQLEKQLQRKVSVQDSKAQGRQPQIHTNGREPSGVWAD